MFFISEELLILAPSTNTNTKEPAMLQWIKSIAEVVGCIILLALASALIASVFFMEPSHLIR